MEQLEKKLDSFSPVERKKALSSLCKKVQAGEIKFPAAGTDVNLHCHTFFSYNSYGYSPSKFAWLSKKSGLAAAGVVDFDVLDALEEFLAASRLLGLKGCAGIESRVFVPEFAEKVINSPGEPGIAYHMGIGFPKAKVKGKDGKFLAWLFETAQQRNRDLTQRVNKYLDIIALDYQRDVLVLTPSGNATERHICLAYARRAKQMFGNAGELGQFWSEKLGCDAESLNLPESKELLNTIRAKTMKQGGVGYVVPDKGSFPLMADFNKFALAAGAIPTVTWLDGTSDGEKEIEKLLNVAMSTGAAALNIIPDRNYKPGVKDQKLKNLYDIVELAEKLNLPVIGGTEMNSPGQKFVDGFDTAELSPLVPVFLKGAYIVYAHSVLQQRGAIGYTSSWAANNFANVPDKNEFFHTVGRSLEPAKEEQLSGINENITPKEILNKING